MQDVVRRLRKFRDDRDWQQFHTAKDLALSVSVEAGELLELFQWRAEGEPVTKELVDNVGSEAADVVLYLLLLCDKLGIDLEQAAATKITRNEQRFPVASSFGIAKPDEAN
jgi:NTP pyrophosphatase (non-canonical NTP hydrolase)